MKVVVTGGAGFIGANLSQTLLAHPEVTEVVALDNLSTGFLSNLDGVGATFVEGDILDADTLDTVLDGASAVVHLAARPSVPRSVKDPVASHHANATGTLNVSGNPGGVGVRVDHGVSHRVGLGRSLRNAVSDAADRRLAAPDCPAAILRRDRDVRRVDPRPVGRPRIRRAVVMGVPPGQHR